ncbi:hypothetical protein SAMN05192588_1340 [Nonlabens sp. Hel1_33_55]|uniref:DUF4870 domain-containing protein n=1 Tax=Nonlabens sp. Hel1_33_55 TaxID=1336802 RepID=UPI000875DFE5|nr:DUF4870 domain-containing protein [Nonlabens sp. Hel1_33_55]SCY13930.1 hypothetical protein SAMN05192588_1340 [Nonlabens sp. Hel1_33_55]
MEKQQQNNHNNIAMGIHLATFGKWIFPLGNFILPILLWMVNSKKSDFIDRHGKQAINFQLSITLWTVILAFIGGGVIIGSMISGGPDLWEAMDGPRFPFANDLGIFSTIVASGVICGTLILALGIVDLVCTIKAAIKAHDGLDYRYPLTINFIPDTPVKETPNTN